MFVNKKQIINVSEEFINTRIDYWLKKNYPSFHYFFLCKLIRKGVVKINGKKCSQNTILKENDLVRIPNILLTKNKIEEYNITPNLSKLVQSWLIYKDRDIIVINKPNGLAVQGGTNIKLNLDLLLDSLKFSYPEKPKIVHRIDKDTSGLLTLARNLKMAKYLSLLFKEKKITKLYLAIVYGRLEKNHDKIKSDIVYDGKMHFSETHFWKLNSNKNYSLLIIKPVTGRKHQIRKHLISKKLQILGDKKYFIHKNRELNNGKTLHLHAFYFSFTDSNEKLRSFTAEIPNHFLVDLKKYGLEFREKLINFDYYT